MSLKALSLIPQLATMESSAWLDEVPQHYAHAMLVHGASENKRADQAIKYIYVARHDCGACAWDILCERLDDRSSAC
jgi:hypothetical protein